MPKKRTSMRKIREIVRLSESQLSQRQISNAVNVSRPVVAQTIESMRSAGLTYAQITPMSDSELNARISTEKRPSGKSAELKERFPYVAKELKRTGVTLKHLWEEYLKEHPEGLKYTQFCYHYQQWRQDEKLSMHIEHKAGDKLFVDYTGKKMVLTDRNTGKTREVEIFVAILPASQLTYAEASENQTQESFVRSNERALRYIGGVPAAIVPDNLKAGVLKASIYEPDLNPLFADFAEYYRTAILPARKKKPKDKAHVENAVKIIYQRVFAPLRNEIFYTIEELNLAIKERLEDHNTRTLTKMTVSRRELYEEVEASELKTLPVHPYPIKHIQPNTLVQFNYHVELKEDRHYYSVPYALKGKRVKLIYDERNVSIYHDNIRIVLHRRDRRSNKYTTERNHMPAKHRFDDNWNPEKLKWWAGNIGDETLRAITHILESKPHPEQAYKSCMGILSQAKTHEHSILNMACRIAWNMERINYGFITQEVKKLKTQYEQEAEQKQLSLLPVIHENVRGEKYYQ
jgi:transposase